MAISQSEFDKMLKEAVGKFEERAIDKKCSSCSKNDWFADLLLLPIQQMTNKQVKIPFDSIPTLILTCKNCGNTRFYNLKVLGLYKDKV